jgi:hypothetical protein
MPERGLSQGFVAGVAAGFDCLRELGSARSRAASRPRRQDARLEAAASYSSSSGVGSKSPIQYAMSADRASITTNTPHFTSEGTKRIA